MSAEKSAKIYSGLGAAPGRASGRAYVIRNAEDVMAVRQVLFSLCASFIHILRHCSRESPDSWSRKAPFFSTPPRLLASAGFRPQWEFGMLAVFFTTVTC